MSGRINFEMQCEKDRKATRSQPVEAMRILLIGNFSGRADPETHRQESLMTHGIHGVDVDNFDTLMARLAPHLALKFGDSPERDIDLDFKEFEDFHPDVLYEHLELSQYSGNRLLDQKSIPTERQEPRPKDEGETNAILFERLLGKASNQRNASQTAGKNAADRLIQTLVEPHVVTTDKLTLQSQRNSVRALSTRLREVLHHPEFQALESVWRSLHRLVSGLKTGEDLKLYVLDMTRRELLMDLHDSLHHFDKSKFYQLLMERGEGFSSEPAWSTIASDFSFGVSQVDISALTTMSSIAAAIGAPFLASATSDLLGCDSLDDISQLAHWHPLDAEQEERWRHLRSSQNAAWLGLAMPRILLRAPYGPEMDAIDSFEFVEIPDSPGQHDDFLWGSGAFACAGLLGLAYQRNGTAMQPGDVADLEDMPVYVYKSEEGKELKPVVEAALSEKIGEAILERGIMPLLGYRNQHLARLLEIRSLAKPDSALRGFWN